MAHPVHPVRSRGIAVAGGLVLALTLAAAPAALAQEEGPEATVVALMDAIEAKDFEALPTFFCEEFAAQAAGFDLSGMAAGLPEGTDAQSLLDAFILDTEVASVEVVSQTDTEAVVKLVATMSMGLNADALAPFIESMLAASGQEVTPDMVEMMTGMLSSEFVAESTDIDEEITLVPGDTMAWLICDELGADVADDGTDDDGTDDDGMDDDGMDADDDGTDDDGSEDETEDE
jgi:hypothetical protein